MKPSLPWILAGLISVLAHAQGVYAQAITAPPAELGLDPFYTKYVSAQGYPIVACEKVDDYALREAAYLVNMMLGERPDVRQAMIDSGSRMVVMAYDQFTTDIPEQRKMQPKDFWDARARGLGGSETDPLCSCGEENLLGFDGDPYASENLLIHEFAHNMHLRGLIRVDPSFNDRLKSSYEIAMERRFVEGKVRVRQLHGVLRRRCAVLVQRQSRARPRSQSCQHATRID